jgi:hypothetical protein
MYAYALPSAGRKVIGLMSLSSSPSGKKIDGNYPSTIEHVLIACALVRLILRLHVLCHGLSNLVGLLIWCAEQM